MFSMAFDRLKVLVGSEAGLKLIERHYQVRVLFSLDRLTYLQCPIRKKIVENCSINWQKGNQGENLTLYE